MPGSELDSWGKVVKRRIQEKVKKKEPHPAQTQKKKNSKKKKENSAGKEEKNLSKKQQKIGKSAGMRCCGKVPYGVLRKV